jgi:hypothetical protein
MAFPVKHASRELKLLDLDDDALIEIIDKLDHKSKMQMMATCKRLEDLLANTFQFYKNFKLVLDEERVPAEPHYCKNIRRNFGIVVLNGTLQGFCGSQIMEIIKNIGENVIQIEIGSGFCYIGGYKVSEADFLQLMKYMPNLRELWSSVTVMEPLSVQPVDAIIPSSLTTLLFIGEAVAEILARQQRLISLSFFYLQINSFNYNPSNCHIKNLLIRDVVFPIKSVFQKFGEFMKIQKSLVDLDLRICERELRNNNDYTDILTHLLSLKSLKKLLIGCGNLIFTPLSKISVCNPAVQNLTIIDPPNGADLQKLANFFPNVTDLQIGWENNIDIDTDNVAINLKPINSMKKIRSLSIDYLTEEMFAQLDLKQMMEFRMDWFGSNPFIIYSDYAFLDEEFDVDVALPIEILEGRSTNWRTFINNNCQLEILHMPEARIPMELLQITLENLPLLKNLSMMVDDCNFSLAHYNPSEYTFDEYLEIYVKEQAVKTAKLIGENYDRFEHLHLVLHDRGEHVVKHLVENYPKVKVEKRTSGDWRDKSLKDGKPCKIIIQWCRQTSK